MEKERILEMFYCWLYTKKLYFSSPKADVMARIPLGFQDIVDAYIFADARVIPKFGNAALDLLFQKIVQCWEFPVISLHDIHENAPEDSKIRQFLVHIAADSHGFRQEYKHSYLRDFLFHVLERLMEQKRYPGEGEMRDQYVQQKCKELCKYHDHSNPEIVGARANA